MASIQQKQSEIIEEIQELESWPEKFDFIIQLGKDFRHEIQEKDRTDAHLVSGCMSKVWLSSELRDGRLFFTADSDSIFVKGLVSLVLQVYSGHPPHEILETPPHFLTETGLLKHLTPARSNGVAAMVRQVMKLAHPAAKILAQRSN